MRIFITNKETGKTIDKPLYSLRQRENGIYTVTALNMETCEVETFNVNTFTHYIDIS